MANSPSPTLGASLDALLETIAARVGADPGSSYTAALLAGGAEKCARKFGEESVEAIVAALSQAPADLAKEAADVLFHLGVLLAAAGVPPSAVAAELEARRGVSGHAEKASRPKS